MVQYIGTGSTVIGPKASANEYITQPKQRNYDSGAELASDIGKIGIKAYGLVAEVEAPPKPTETPTESPAKPKEKEGDDLDERVKRIIREIPGPTPQPGGE